MKLIIPLILVAVLHVSGATYGQKVTISKKKAALVEIFKAISEQTGREFLASPALLEKTQPVDVNVKDKEISEFLPALLAKQGLVYSLLNNVIVITKDTKSFFPVAPVAVAPIDPPKILKGWVMDPTGVTLPGATVMIKGTRKGVSTDAKGYFELKVEDGSENVEVVISYTGYSVKTATLSFSRPTVVYLKPSTSELDQVQVIAYGTTTKRFNTGNVSTVTAAEIAKNPVSNPLLALQGRVAGLVINQTSGMPGGAVNVRLRGTNSIGNGNDILYLVDGIPFRGGTSGSINQGLSQGNLLDFLNPADIESIEVLKDADATSIYGSRGANGVILITTKKGKAGNTSVNINAYTGIAKTTRLPKYLNLQQYLAMRREAFANDGVQPSPFDYDVNGTWDTTRYTDWQKEILGGTAHTSDVQGSISGGTDNVRYFLGGGYHREDPVMPVDGSVKKGSVHFNFNSTSNDKKLQIDAGGSYLASNNTIVPVDPARTIASLAPNAPAPYHADGSLNWENGTFRNPFAELRTPYIGKGSTLNGNVTITYHVLKSLDAKVLAGYQQQIIDEYTGAPTSINNPFRPQPPSSATYMDATYSAWNIEPQLTYSFVLGKGKVETLLGETFRQQKNFNIITRGVGYTSDALLQDPRSAATLSALSGNDAYYKYNATFGRIKYNWDNKYLVNLNGRYDGSSRFGPANRFHFFWSAGGAWIFTEEKAVKELLPFLSYGKLRGSYGTTGNDNIGDYRYLDLYSSSSLAYQGVRGLQPNRLYNPELAWEKTTKAEGAIDLGFLKDKILVSAAYYSNRSSNQLLPTSLSAVTGNSTILLNIPALVTNKGWEFELHTTNIKTKNFEWTSFFNIALPRNKLVRFDGLSPTEPGFIIGQPLQVMRLYDYAGVDPQTGTYVFNNSEGKQVPMPDMVTTFVAPNIPKYNGGFQNTVSYKGLSLDFLLQFEKQTVQNPLGAMIAPPGSFSNQPAALVLDHWQKPGDEVDVAKYSQSFTSIIIYGTYIPRSTRAWSTVGFVRLKNLSLSYQLPAKLIKKMKLQQLAVFAQGQNLLTFTSKEFRDYDPESGGINLPPMRVFTGGIRLTY